MGKMITRSVDSGVRSAIEEVLMQQLQGYGVTGIDIVADQDHTGDDALMITVNYDNEGDNADLDVLAGLVTKVRDRLWAMGEERFPYIENNFIGPDDEDDLEDSLRPATGGL